MVPKVTYSLRSFGNFQKNPCTFRKLTYTVSPEATNRLIDLFFDFALGYTESVILVDRLFALIPRAP